MVTGAREGVEREERRRMRDVEAATREGAENVRPSSSSVVLA